MDSLKMTKDLSIKDLKAALSSRGFSIKGNKAVLENAYEYVLQCEAKEKEERKAFNEKKKDYKPGKKNLTLCQIRKQKNRLILFIVL